MQLDLAQYLRPHATGQAKLRVLLDEYNRARDDIGTDLPRAGPVRPNGIDMDVPCDVFQFKQRFGVCRTSTDDFRAFQFVQDRAA